MSTVIIQGQFQLNQPESCAYGPFWLGEQASLVLPLPDCFQKENSTIWKGSAIKRPKRMHREDDLKYQWNEKTVTHTEPDTVGSLLHPFCKKTFTEHLLCAWPCSIRGYKNESNVRHFTVCVIRWVALWWSERGNGAFKSAIHWGRNEHKWQECPFHMAQIVREKLHPPSPGYKPRRLGGFLLDL